MTYLLDVNLLVALTWREHVLHDSAQRWFADLDDEWATSTTTESGFVRVSMNPRVTSAPVAWSPALAMLDSIRATPGHQWWAEDVDLTTSPVVRRAPVVGHRQVTDVHLAALATHHRARLATLDLGVGEALHPDDRGVIALVPAGSNPPDR